MTGPQEHAPKSWRQALKHAFHLSWMHGLHHLIGATMIAALMLALESGHALAWLDGAMLRLSAQQQQSVAEASDTSAGRRPSIVEIDSAAFVDVFDERAPLERERLGQLLERVAAAGAKVMAVDIDLSPAAYERRQSGPRPLDGVLDGLVRRGAQLVLVLPDPSERNLNLGWIRARCAAGIHFASPMLTERMGAVTRVDRDSPRLAAVTHELAEAQAGGHGPGHGPDHGPGLAGQVCHDAATSTSEAALYLAATKAPPHGHGAGHGATAPFHPMAAALRYLVPTVSSVVLRDGKVELQGGAALRPVAFIGGSYDVLDEFRTFEGRAPGLYLHAAAFTSLDTGTGDVSHLAVFVFDIIFGMLLGWLFAGVWMLYRQYEEKADHKLSQQGGLWGGILSFWWGRLLLVAVWLLPVLLAFVAVYLSHYLLIGGWWVNPGPLIGGMFLHAMALRDESREHHAEAAAPSWFMGLLKAHPGAVLVQLPLTLALLAYALI